MYCINIFFPYWQHLWALGKMLLLLIPSFYNFCKIKYQGNSTCDFSFFMIYGIISVLYCTKDMFEFHLLLAMIVLFPYRYRNYVSQRITKPQWVKCGRSKKKTPWNCCTAACWNDCSPRCASGFRSKISGLPRKICETHGNIWIAKASSASFGVWLCMRLVEFMICSRVCVCESVCFVPGSAGAGAVGGD